MTLTDAGIGRFQARSFCLVMFLIATGGLRAAWNQCGRNVSWLPRSSSGQALRLMSLAGLVAWPTLALTAGGIEPIAPRVWLMRGLDADQAGPVADLGGDPERPLPEGGANEARRRERLATLKEYLWEFAREHGGNLPDRAATSEHRESVWGSADPSRIPYRYVPGAKANAGAALVAYEPGLYGAERLALFSDGAIRPLMVSEIQHALAPGR